MMCGCVGAGVFRYAGVWVQVCSGGCGCVRVGAGVFGWVRVTDVFECVWVMCGCVCSEYDVFSGVIESVGASEHTGGVWRD